MGYSINVLAPSNPVELAEALRDAAAAGRTIALAGNSTKCRMAGPVEPAEVSLTTLSLGGVLQYEPRDLTISVGAGLSWCEFTRLLAENRQMVPLDPPFADDATVGGVISANCSGPRRRLYGTARDLVIGMQFATLEGKLVKSGGMVVKNVAGLDMAKLMIGSFGTLAAIAVVNFKLQPMPEVERSFLLPFDSLAAAIAARNRHPEGPVTAGRHRSAEPGCRPDAGQLHMVAGVARRRQRGRCATLRTRIHELHRCPGIRGGAPADTLAPRGELHAAVPGGAPGWRGGARFVYPEEIRKQSWSRSPVRRWRARARVSAMAISNDRKPPRTG